MGFEFEPVATIETPYPEKFSVPRQPGLVNADKSRLRLLDNCNREEILRGLEGFSHLWLIWVFDQALRQNWKPTVRPPRLGGNRKLGVFATRSPFRPNPIGLSVVKLRGIHRQEAQWYIDISGADLVDGTPILDIKPYIAYSDVIVEAGSGYAGQAPERIAVSFSDSATAVIAANSNRYPELEQLLIEVLSQLPRPAYHEDSPRRYGTRLLTFNIQWRIVDGGCHVEAIQSLQD